MTTAPTDPAWIYLLLDPRDERPRYVGWTVNLKRRFSFHVYSDDKRENCRRARWLRFLRKQGLKPLLRAVFETTAELAPSAEVCWIAHFRIAGFDLVNGTDGGDGAVGRKVSEEAKRKLSDARRGRKLSEGTRIKISEALKGRAFSLGTRAKIANKLRGNTYGRAHKGRALTDETKYKISESRRGQKYPAASVPQKNRWNRWSSERQAQEVGRLNQGYRTWWAALPDVQAAEHVTKLLGSQTPEQRDSNLSKAKSARSVWWNALSEEERHKRVETMQRGRRHRRDI